jgi:uncharacterized protein YjbI with pentapeptide repeats
MTRTPRWTGFAGKTLWDWLELLLIPLALAAVAFGLNYFANEREQRRDDRRAARERALAADARRDDALRIYLQQMSSLMLERDLRTSRPGSEVQAVARAFTLTVLRRLDSERKGLVVRFLSQAGLIGSELQNRVPFVDFRHPPTRLRTEMPPSKVNLGGADLRNVALRSTELIAKSFEGADLRGADFREAHLEATTFDQADLRNADFRDALLGSFVSSGRPASFREACVTDARFDSAEMDGINFSAQGVNVDLSHANLERADLRNAILSKPKLVGAVTRGTRFPPPGSWERMLAGIEWLVRLGVRPSCRSAVLRK